MTSLFFKASLPLKTRTLFCRVLLKSVHSQPFLFFAQEDTIEIPSRTLNMLNSAQSSTDWTAQNKL